MLQLFHFLFGFVFSFIDTDGFMPELNVFTLHALVSVGVTAKVYRYLFLFYFLFVSRGLWTSAVFRRWKILTLGMGLFGVAAIVRIVFDGYLTRYSIYRDIFNILAMGGIAAGVANPAAWDSWLRSFIKGAVVALLIRAVCHIAGVGRVYMEGVGFEIQGFYGTFSIHCVVLVVAALCVAIAALRQNNYRKAAISGLLSLLFLAVVATSYRRWSMIMCAVQPAIALVIAYALKGELSKRIPVIAGASCLAIAVVVAGFIAAYGVTVASERLTSIVNPLSKTSSLESNMQYLDDATAFWDLIQEKPFGVGYGNFYGVPRLVDQVLDGVSFLDLGSDDEIPLHIGTFEMVARMGIFGLGPIVAPMICLFAAYRRSRNAVDWNDAFLLGFSITSFLLPFLQPFAAPLIGEIKIFGLYGIFLGLALQVEGRASQKRAMQPSRRESVYRDEEADGRQPVAV